MMKLSEELGWLHGSASKQRVRLADLMLRLFARVNWPEEKKQLIRSTLESAVAATLPPGTGPTFGVKELGLCVEEECRSNGLEFVQATCEIGFKACLRLEKFPERLSEADLTLVKSLRKLLEQEPSSSSKTTKEYQTPELGFDLSLALSDQQLPPAASQPNFDEAIEQVLECLLFGKKMPVLVGEPGVGKSTVARQLAWLLARSNQLVPRPLLGCRLVSMSRSDLMAGANKRGKTEEVAKTLVSMADRRYSKNVVFIDEIHSIFDNSKETAALAQELKPKMATGELRLIGATTRREFDEYLTVDSAMLDRIQIVNLNPPSATQTIAIIKNAKQQILGEAASANIDLDDDCAQSAVKLSTEQLPLEFQPRKSIDLIQSAVARVWRTYDRDARKDPSLVPPKVGSQDIAKALGRRLGMDPAAFAFDAETKFSNIERSMLNHVAGHDSAISRIVQHLKDQERGVYGSDRPKGVYLLVGPNGVGKAHLSMWLSRAFFMIPDGGDLRDRFCRLDLATVPGEMGVAAFKGASAGYVGYRATRTIYGEMRTSPNRVILLQNVDKNLLIAPLIEEIAADGVAVDGAGYPANFRSAIIVMTCAERNPLSSAFDDACDDVIELSMPNRDDLAKAVFIEWKARCLLSDNLPDADKDVCKRLVLNCDSPRQALKHLANHLRTTTQITNLER